MIPSFFFCLILKRWDFISQYDIFVCTKRILIQGEGYEYQLPLVEKLLLLLTLVPSALSSG